MNGIASWSAPSFNILSGIPFGTYVQAYEGDLDRGAREIKYISMNVNIFTQQRAGPTANKNV